MLTKPWNIYAEQLTPIGYGRPLWNPEPDTTSREVHIGDVGWLKEGHFVPLFNSMRAAEHPLNQGKVPRDFQEMGHQQVLDIGKMCALTQSMVVSQGMQLEGGTLSPRMPPGRTETLAAGWKFRSSADIGAFLVLDPPGIADDIYSSLSIIDYMRENLGPWLEFVNSSDLHLDDKDLIFICGTVKVSRWAVAAFQGAQFRDAEGYVSGQLGRTGDQGFKIHRFPISHYMTGPIRASSSSNLNLEDQCLFIHYYKMKRRTSGEDYGRTAIPPGPHKLLNQDGASSSGEGATKVGDMCPDLDSENDHGLEIEDSSRVESEYDPVDPVLDYILRNSEACIAVASDEDVTKLLGYGTFPDSDDLLNVIMQMSPLIDIDEHGVGTISNSDED